MKKNKNILLILLLITLIIILMVIYFRKDDDKIDNSKVISYQGNNLRVGIDGSNSDTLPTSGNYYLISYECDNANTKVSWDRTNYKLTVSNGKDGGGVSCNLEFKSKPLLSEMAVGSYVAYTGSGGKVGSTSVACQTNGSDSSSTEFAETEAPNSCKGQNAREDLDSSGYTYGYCYSADYKYYTTGWRIAYIDSNNKPVIVSAGSPECNSRTESTANVTYIQTANAKALKYCNTAYVDGNCTCTDSDSDGLCDSASTDAWAINDTDFYNMTKAISGYGKRLTNGSSSLGDSGGTLGSTLYCGGKYSYRECGYNNSLIDNGGYYWFAAQYSSSSSDASGVYWYPDSRSVRSNSNTSTYGLRPVISLSSTIRVTEGSGTMADPYTIDNYLFSINDGNLYTNSTGVTLTLSDNGASTMCISNTSDCSSYETFATSKSWTLTSGDGEKTVYVYYKDSDGKIIASTSKKITLDTTAPTNNSISVGSVSGNYATLSISSSGANYMCFSSTNDSSGCSWVDYATSYKYKFDKTNGSKTIYGFFKDYAGNMSSTSVSYSCTTCENFSVNYPFDGSETIDEMNAEGLITIAGTSSNSAYDWVIDSTNKYFKSGNYNVNSSTGSSTITFTPTIDCSLSFDYGVGSESNYDKLTIILNDGSTDTTLVNAISGSKTGSITNQALTGGTTYVLTLKYVKDGSSHTSPDIGYIKNFVIE